MKMSENNRFFSFALDSAHVKFDVWTRPYLVVNHGNVRTKFTLEKDIAYWSLSSELLGSFSINDGNGNDNDNATNLIGRASENKGAARAARTYEQD